MWSRHSSTSTWSRALLSRRTAHGCSLRATKRFSGFSIYWALRSSCRPTRLTDVQASWCCRRRLLQRCPRPSRSARLLYLATGWQLRAKWTARSPFGI
ncbi:hypothetical protein L917_15953 [Phytophthora nicotianae]|uniref:Uncharacterized protein n=1 Tax=Phytophthora nicotianae TaxID=4792 RepID=W2KHS9_PHYNI|nr:hypothetical protein L917_15953 [Phytophthora nicotianae]